MPPSLLASLLVLLASPSRPPQPAPAPPGVPPHVARAWATLGPPRPWPSAPADGPDRVRLVQRQGDLAIQLLRPQPGRLLEQALRLPTGASPQAAADALSLQIEFLQASPATAGRPWPPRPAGPPPIPTDPPWPGDLRHELQRPPLRFPPLRTPPVPSPPTPWPAPPARSARVQAPVPAARGQRGLSFGLVALLDPSPAASVSLRLDWAVGAAWRIHTLTAVAPFDRLGDDPVLRARLTVGGSRALAGPDGRWRAYGSLGIEGALPEVPGVHLDRAIRPTLDLGLALRLARLGPLDLETWAGVTGSPWAMEGRGRDDQRRTLRARFGARAGAWVRFPF